MTQQPVQANLFTLTSDNAQITYSTSGIDGRPHFSYQRGDAPLNFTGDEIRTTTSELGQLVSVSILKTVDQGYTSLTLLLPDINMADQYSQDFSTLAIITKHLSGIRPFQHGARATYEVLNLQGTAQFVEF